MIYRTVGALIKKQKTIRLDPASSVQKAAEKMAEHRVGAISVEETGQLKGIFTERDLVNRVVAKGLRPQDVSLQDVMTENPITVTADTALVPCLRIMSENNFRHLPVIEREQVVGVLSRRDIPTTSWIFFEWWESARNGLKVASG